MIETHSKIIRPLMNQLKAAGCKCETFDEWRAILIVLETALQEAREQGRADIRAQVLGVFEKGKPQ